MGGGARSGPRRGQRRLTGPRILGSTDRDLPALQQPHGHVSQQHSHLLGPGHAAQAPVIVGHVHAAGGRPGFRVRQDRVWGAGREKGRGSGAPEVPATAVLGQHVAAAALEVQQAAVEGAVMRVSEGHAGSGPGQAAGTAAAGTQGGGLVLASARHTIRHAALPAGPHAEPPQRTEHRRGGSRAPEPLLAGVRTPPRGRVRHCTTRASPSPISPVLQVGGATRPPIPPPQALALTGPQESGAQRWLWQHTVPATQEQLVQASTSQRSPEATRRPWCAHDGAGAGGTGRGRVRCPPLTLGLAPRPDPQPHGPGPHLGTSHSTGQPPAPSPSRAGR